MWFYGSHPPKVLRWAALAWFFARKTMTENEIQEGRRNIEQFLDHIDEETNWTVVDYNPNIDPYQLTSVTITAEHYPEANVVESEDDANQVETVKDIVTSLEQENPDGAEREEVIKRAWDQLDLAEGGVEAALIDLKSKGELYEPTTDRLKTT